MTLPAARPDPRGCRPSAERRPSRSAGAAPASRRLEESGSGRTMPTAERRGSPAWAPDRAGPARGATALHLRVQAERERSRRLCAESALLRLGSDELIRGAVAVGGDGGSSRCAADVASWLALAPAPRGRVACAPARRRGAAARESPFDPFSSHPSAADAAGAPGGSAADDAAEDALPTVAIWAGGEVYGTRVLVDDDGTKWTVREVDARAIPGARRSRCLFLENHETVRRLWRYPPRWLELSDAALLGRTLGRS